MSQKTSIHEMSKKITDTISTDQGGKIVSVLSSKGGVGKSTIALSLATDLAQNSSVCVVDLDFREGQIARYTGYSNPTAAILETTELSAESVKNALVHDTTLGLDILLAPLTQSGVDTPSTDFYNRILDVLTASYDYVVLDTPVVHHDVTIRNMVHNTADHILYVTDTGVNSVKAMSTWIQVATEEQELDGFGIPESKIGVVVNKYSPTTGCYQQTLKNNMHGIPLLTTVPSQAKTVVSALVNQSFEKVLENDNIRPAIKQLSRTITG